MNPRQGEQTSKALASASVVSTQGPMPGEVPCIRCATWSDVETGPEVQLQFKPDVV